MPRRRAHRGWTEAHVRRLFWRAGFGATPREARHWARRGKGATIRWLLNGGPSPAPRMKPARVDGRRLDPENEWGHDVLWWLDRMIRSRHPLQEKLTLFTYPEDSDFGERLRYLAAMISKPLGIRVADVEADADFDTHDNQLELAMEQHLGTDASSVIPRAGAFGRVALVE